MEGGGGGNVKYDMAEVITRDKKGKMGGDSVLKESVTSPPPQTENDSDPNHKQNMNPPETAAIKDSLKYLKAMDFIRTDID